jgi:hypothetical protein
MTTPEDTEIEIFRIKEGMTDMTVMYTTCMG